ncbi:MAG: hypothetical protein IJ716_09700 [Lachnospiraceae bacterium]|nr:hypothetical protein [Lachnospiraceae bacterium]
MNTILSKFCLLPMWIRAAILLFLLIVLLYKLFGKIIFFIFSVLPFLLQKFYRCVFCIIEFPMEKMHKRIGGLFSKIDNYHEQIGKTIDNTLESWYKKWHSYETLNTPICILIYIVCVVYIVIPSYIEMNVPLVNIGNSFYMYTEEQLVNWLKKSDTIVSRMSMSEIDEEQDEIEENELGLETVKGIKLTLIVTGVKTSLLVRDIPSLEGNRLESLKNDDEVTWQGRLAFAEADERVEPWVYIYTANGVEGWSRLYYLQPNTYGSIEYCVVWE